jgi:hypothetical protein
MEDFEKGRRMPYFTRDASRIATNKRLRDELIEKAAKPKRRSKTVQLIRRSNPK